MNKHTVALLQQHFDTAFAAPDGVKKLRELILTLAMQGKLVPQDPNDPPASQLLNAIEAEKKRLVNEGKIKAPKPLAEIKSDDVPYAVPRSWEWVRIGSICSYIQRGKGPKYVESSTHRVISQKCVRWSGLDLKPARHVDPKSLEKYEPIRFLCGGDLLWNSTGTGTIGRACLVPDELDGKELVADSHVTVVRSQIISKSFLWRWIQSPIVQSEIENSASGTTNQIELNTSTVINHLLPLPPLAEQHRIVAKIEQLMARCDELEKLRAEREQRHLSVHAAAINRLTSPTASFPRRRESMTAENLASHPCTPEGMRGNDDGMDSLNEAWQFITQHFAELYAVKPNVAELRKAILQLAVMGKLVPQDPNDPPASELLKEIEAEKQRLVKEGKIRGTRSREDAKEIKPKEMPYALPLGWEWVRFGKVANNRLGKMLDKSKNRGNPKPYLRNTNVQWHQFVLDDVKEMKFEDDELVEFRVLPGDLLICEGGEPGRCAIWSNLELEIYFQKAIHRARPFSCVTSEYLQVCLTNDGGNGQLAKYFTGATIKHFPGDKLNGYVIPLPPLTEQHRIVAKIDSLMALCDTLEQQIDAATSKQTALLDAVMALV